MNQLNSKTLVSYLLGFPLKAQTSAFFFKSEYRTFQLSYSELFCMVSAIAAEMRERGFRKGDRVMLWGANTPGWAAVFIACAAEGFVAVPMDAGASAVFVEKIIRLTHPSLILCDEARRLKIKHSKAELFDEFLDHAMARPSGEFVFRDVALDDTAEILFTSGTTAEPKGVVLTHHNIVSNVEALAKTITGLTSKEKWLSVLPLSHVFEQTIGLWLPLRLGYSVTYLKILKPSSILKSLEEDAITIVPIVPRVLKLMRDGIFREAARLGKEKALNLLLAISGRLPFSFRQYLFPSVRRRFGRHRFFVSGGAALEPELELFWERLGLAILQGYGLSETSPVISCNLPAARKMGSIGKVLPGVHVKLSEEGEILVRGPSVFQGYFQDPGKTREAFEDDWFKTGDLGQLDRDGFLYFRGRKKEVIVTEAGLKVYPGDIEAALHAVKGVKESCVFEAREEGRSAVHAALLLEKRSLDPKALVREANAGLSEYQQIQSFSVWPFDDFPRTTTMKIKKEEVRRLLGEIREKGAANVEFGAGADEPPLLRLIRRLAGRGAEAMNADSRLGDLGLSSLDRVELASMIEEEYRLDMDDGFLTGETRLHEIDAFIRSKTALPQKREHFRWPASRAVMAIRMALQDFFLLPLLSYFCRIKVQGREWLEGINGSVFFVANHQSYFDAPAIFAVLPRRIRRKMAAATWREFFDAEGGGWRKRCWKRFAFYFVLVCYNSFLLSQVKSFKPSFEHAGWLIDHGFHVLFFPEGERTHTGAMSDFKPGIGRLVRAMQIPVVPVGIQGLYDVFPRYKKFPGRGEVTIRFGPAIFFGKESNEAIAERLEREVRKLAGKSER